MTCLPVTSAAVATLAPIVIFASGANVNVLSPTVRVLVASSYLPSPLAVSFAAGLAAGFATGLASGACANAGLEATAVLAAATGLAGAVVAWANTIVLNAATATAAVRTVTKRRMGNPPVMDVVCDPPARTRTAAYFADTNDVPSWPRPGGMM